MFIPPNQKKLMEAIKERLQSFDGDVLSLYKLFGEFEGELEFSAFEQDVLAAVDRYLTEHGLERDTMMRIAQLFLLKEPVNARKAEAVAAGLIAGATENAVFGDRDVTQKEIGEYFDVTGGTLAKYRDMVADFIAERVSQVVSEQFGTAEEIGTDPQPTERELWEMFTRVSRHEGASADELDRMLQEEQNQPFEPATDEERAQQFCYDAYDSGSDAERLQLARQAAELAPDLPDVNLLLAEQEEDILQKETYFLKAVNTGLRRYESDFDDSWLYVPNRPALRALFAFGAWKITQGDTERALQELAHLLERNSQDHQGTGWLLASSLLTEGKLAEAGQLLDVLDSVAENARLYLSQLRESLEAGASYDAAVDALLALDADEGVKERIRSITDPGMFPRRISLVEEEAQFTYWLLYWPLMKLKAAE
ncbi:hypothetical protein [Planococcus lenghuensis]|uniref:Tetratricopeptide repeat protein n=1 Tax=Planococcus lenghuensis TaxID=2213202 RepID=A0A1Q2L0R5_9BACL|nr:hypothetical protein [Planococcus lenghuensis]AQQ54038.1 hypothetical protein B0X71_13640 [Planococcus lenghuensis]